MTQHRFPSMAALQEAIRAARSEAEREARESCGRGGFLQSRGSYLRGTNSTGGEPLWAADTYPLGTWKELQVSLADVAANRPEIDAVIVQGGFNWAATMQNLRDGAYDVLVSEWEVRIWERNPAPQSSDD